MLVGSSEAVRMFSTSPTSQVNGGLKVRQLILVSSMMMVAIFGEIALIKNIVH